MTNMNQFKLTTVAALTMITTSVFAELGETPREFEPRRADETYSNRSGTTMVWRGKALTHSGWFVNGRASVESFWWNDYHRMNSDDLTRFMKPYNWLQIDREWQKAGAFFFKNMTSRGATSKFPAGTVMGVVIYNSDNSLQIYSSWAWSDAMAAADEAAARDKNAATAQPQVAQSEKQSKLDCVIVAAENLKRLEPISFWAKRLQIKYTVNGEKIEVGHVVVVWKDKPGSEVKVIDDNGMITLKTRSTDLKTILASLGKAYSYTSKNKVTLIGRFDGEKEDQAAATAHVAGLVTFFGIFTLGAGAFGWLGWTISKNKGRGTAGFWLGFCLGILGLIAAANLRRKTPPPVSPLMQTSPA